MIRARTAIGEWGRRLMDIDLDLAAIEEAARIVDPVFRDSPQFICEQLCARSGAPCSSR
jgi:hypothetical protein